MKMFVGIVAPALSVLLQACKDPTEIVSPLKPPTAKQYYTFFCVYSLIKSDNIHNQKGTYILELNFISMLNSSEASVRKTFMGVLFEIFLNKQVQLQLL